MTASVSEKNKHYDTFCCKCKMRELCDERNYYCIPLQCLFEVQGKDVVETLVEQLDKVF